MDDGDAAQARVLLDRFADDKSIPFSFSRALIEHIAILLAEPDSSETLLNNAIRAANQANPYAIWMFVYNDVFEEAVEYTDEIQEPVPIGSVEEAILRVKGKRKRGLPRCTMAICVLYKSQLYVLTDIDFVLTDDFELWSSTDGALEALERYIEEFNLPYPSIITTEDPECMSTVVKANTDNLISNQTSVIEIYRGMYQTAIDMIQDMKK